jgi:cytochrome c oxidase subunit 4
MSHGPTSPAKHEPHGGHHYTPEEINRHVRTYMVVFAALAALTVVTVAISYIHLPVHQAIVLAVIVASVKASLVALYFMHLISERRVIYVMLIIAAVFFVAVMCLPAMTEAEVRGWLVGHVP